VGVGGGRRYENIARLRNLTYHQVTEENLVQVLPPSLPPRAGAEGAAADCRNDESLLAATTGGELFDCEREWRNCFYGGRKLARTFDTDENWFSEVACRQTCGRCGEPGAETPEHPELIIRIGDTKSTQKHIGNEVALANILREKALESGIEPTFVPETLGSFIFQGRDIVNLREFKGPLGWQDAENLEEVVDGDLDGYLFASISRFVPGKDYGNEDIGFGSWWALQDYMRQVLTGLSVAHDAGYLVNDLKPDNIRYDEDEPVPHAVLSDLGATKKFYENMAHSFTQTPYWSPPQENIWMTTQVKETAVHGPDIWSLGVIFLDALYYPCYTFDKPSPKHHKHTDSHSFMLGLQALLAGEFVMAGRDIRDNPTFKQHMNDPNRNAMEKNLYHWNPILKDLDAVAPARFEDRIKLGLVESSHDEYKCPESYWPRSAADGRDRESFIMPDEGDGAIDAAHDLAQSMLRLESLDRVTAKQALEHDFFKLQFERPPLKQPTSSAVLFDTSKCGIAWHSVIPDNTLPYFFPLPAAPAPASPPPSACITHPELLAVRCYVNKLSIYPSRINVAMGGEPLESVMGQLEDVEFAEYSPGAFASPDRGLLPSNDLSHGWYINNVLAGMVSQEPTRVCSQTPTLFITRYEYVNLFHTVTDWWNIFEAVPQEFWAANAKLDLVWLDGHPQGNLDSTWRAAFGEATPVKHLPEGACFERAVVVSAGYASPLWLNNRSWNSPPCIPAADAFAHHMLKAYGHENLKRVPKRVVIIDRVPYTAHPRSKPGKMPRAIANIEKLEAAVRDAGGEVKVVRFEQLSVGDQLKEVREADILVGIHGAGLSHVLFMSEGSTMVELQTNSFGMFDGFARWRPEVSFVSVQMGNGGGNYVLNDVHVNSVLELL
ncbi:hypothetical protein TeGR_g118, partial [Tetraparma gracilis]